MLFSILNIDNSTLLELLFSSLFKCSALIIFGGRGVFCHATKEYSEKCLCFDDNKKVLFGTALLMTNTFQIKQKHFQVPHSTSTPSRHTIQLRSIVPQYVHG